MITYSPTKQPNITELENVWQVAFSSLMGNDGESTQTLREWFDIDEITEYLPHGLVIEAREEEQLVGAILVGKHNILSWPDGHKAEVFNVGVLPEFRSKGIGKELLAQAEENMLAFGAQAMIINTHSEMPETQAWYINQGYSVMGTLEHYYDNGNAIFLIKKLV